MRRNDSEDDFGGERENDDFDTDDFDTDDFDIDNTADTAQDAEQISESEADTEQPDEAGEDGVLSRRRRGKRHIFKKIRVPLFIVLGIIIFAAAVVTAYARTTLTDGRIMENVYINELDVSGFTREETMAAVEGAYLFEDTEIVLRHGDLTYPISGADITMTAITEETVDKAMDYCHSGNFITDTIGAVRLIFAPKIIVPSAQVDTEKLDAKLGEFGNIVLGERIQHRVEFGDDGMVTVYPGKTGYNGDPTAAREAVLTALRNSDFTDIDVSYESAAPDEMTVERFDLLVYKDPVDAYYDIKDNTVTVIAGETGRYINREEAAPLVVNVREGGEEVRIPYYISQPEHTAEELGTKLFNATLGKYSTSYGTSTSNRCANIARAASLINGKVLAPGEVFSFNDTVGHRTTANGFYTAKEYVNGKSVDGIGGGTCQVSSTLYSAVLYADMGIVERLNHMMTVGYIPLGQDATVSDGGVDFKFKNTSDYPVKISAVTGGATITVSIIGTEWSPAKEVKIINNSSMSGKNTVVKSVRQVWVNGALQRTDNLPSSTYMPHESENEVDEATRTYSSAASSESTESTESTESATSEAEEETAGEASSEEAEASSEDSSDSEEE